MIFLFGIFFILAAFVIGSLFIQTALPKEFFGVTETKAVVMRIEEENKDRYLIITDKFRFTIGYKDIFAVGDCVLQEDFNKGQFTEIFKSKL